MSVQFRFLLIDEHYFRIFASLSRHITHNFSFSALNFSIVQYQKAQLQNLIYYIYMHYWRYCKSNKFLFLKKSLCERFNFVGLKSSCIDRKFYSLIIH